MSNILITRSSSTSSRSMDVNKNDSSIHLWWSFESISGDLNDDNNIGGATHASESAFPDVDWDASPDPDAGVVVPATVTVGVDRVDAVRERLGRVPSAVDTASGSRLTRTVRDVVAGGVDVGRHGEGAVR